MAALSSASRATGVDARHAVREASAVQLLYERHARRLLNYCRYHLGSQEDAEDAVQTTFLHALRALRRGVIPAAESPWLLKIARNVCLSHKHAARRRSHHEVAHDPQALEELVVGPAHESEELIRLEEALARMPESQRRAILLREWKGLSYREIAEELELSQAAVETLIFRARRSLAESLEANLETRPRRRVMHGLNLGSLLASLKSALLGGSAAKIVTAAAAVAATTTVAIALPRADPSPARPENPGVVAVRAPAGTPASRASARGDLRDGSTSLRDGSTSHQPVARPLAPIPRSRPTLPRRPTDAPLAPALPHVPSDPPAARVPTPSSAEYGPEPKRPPEADIAPRNEPAPEPGERQAAVKLSSSRGALPALPPPLDDPLLDPSSALPGLTPSSLADSAPASELPDAVLRPPLELEPDPSSLPATSPLPGPLAPG